MGLAALAVRNSYNCGILGLHTNRLAAAGLIGIGFTNAPASIAPVGGIRPVVGTNPVALSVPDGAGGIAFSIDQSSSAVAKSEVMKHAREGKPIPLGWALDREGRPTTDPSLGLVGSMAPSGGYKGVGIALMVEVLAAAATGAVLGIDASPFSGPDGGPPRTGQFFLALDARRVPAGLSQTELRACARSSRVSPAHVCPGRAKLPLVPELPRPVLSRWTALCTRKSPLSQMLLVSSRRTRLIAVCEPGTRAGIARTGGVRHIGANDESIERGPGFTRHMTAPKSRRSRKRERPLASHFDPGGRYEIAELRGRAVQRHAAV